MLSAKYVYIAIVFCSFFNRRVWSGFFGGSFVVLVCLEFFVCFEGLGFVGFALFCSVLHFLYLCYKSICILGHCLEPLGRMLASVTFCTNLIAFFSVFGECCMQQSTRIAPKNCFVFSQLGCKTAFKN